MYQKQTTTTGTVRINRKGLPDQVIHGKLGQHQVSEQRKGPLLCVAYRDGKETPVLISTVAKAGFTTVHRPRKRDKELPCIVEDYNKVMGGVDLKDTKLYAYLGERKSLKWTVKAAFSLFGTALLNSYIAYKKNTSQTPILSRYLFMINIIESLAGQYNTPKTIKVRRSKVQIQASRLSPQSVAAPSHVISPYDGHDMKRLPVGKKRDCAAAHAKRVRTCYMCPQCNKGFCPECFPSYHKKLRE